MSWPKLLYVPLKPEDRERLSQLALVERRRVQDQAAYMITKALAQIEAERTAVQE